MTITLLSGNELQIILLRNEAGPLLPEECKLLELETGAICWIREVYLAGLGRPWVFARSIITSLDREAGDSPLFGLGEVPFGTVLFGNAPYQRSEIEVCRYMENGQTGQPDDEPLWARRSIFSRQKKSHSCPGNVLPELWDELRKTEFMK
ncbi:chorismate--pyruvate lyase family protein [Pseudomonas sp. DSP3-2-2]|uniref:chorismate--pyruvate lyase family protein n=1 Tax=unclassified Pseudomonas TaxID=196821 RepID=UPI003CEC93F5